MLRATELIEIDPANLNQDTKFLLSKLLRANPTQSFFDKTNFITESTATYSVHDGSLAHQNVDIHLTQSLVKYHRKKSPTESRYAICSLHARGGEGLIYISNATLFFKKNDDGIEDLVSKEKTDEAKKRVVKQLHQHRNRQGILVHDDRNENDKAKNEFIFMQRVDMPGLKSPITSADGSRSAVIMRLLKDKALFDYLTEDHYPTNTFTVDQLLDLSIIVCDAISKVHVAGIIHRDIKPHNIMAQLDRNNNPILAVVIDFGFAKWKDALVKEDVGTERYASPEAKSGRMTDEKSDVYAFGWVLYFIWKDIYDKPIYKNLAEDHKEKLATLVERMTAHRGKKRPDLAEVKQTLVNIKEERAFPQLSSHALTPDKNERKCVIF